MSSTYSFFYDAFLGFMSLHTYIYVCKKNKIQISHRYCLDYKCKKDSKWYKVEYRLCVNKRPSSLARATSKCYASFKNFDHCVICVKSAYSWISTSKTLKKSSIKFYRSARTNSCQIEIEDFFQILYWSQNILTLMGFSIKFQSCSI